jgi:hypothetical protein
MCSVLWSLWQDEVNILSIQFSLGICYVCTLLCFALQVLAILCLCIKNAKIEAYKKSRVYLIFPRMRNFGLLGLALICSIDSPLLLL